MSDADGASLGSLTAPGVRTSRRNISASPLAPRHVPLSLSLLLASVIGPAEEDGGILSPDVIELGRTLNAPGRQVFRSSSWTPANLGLSIPVGFRSSAAGDWPGAERRWPGTMLDVRSVKELREFLSFPARDPLRGVMAFFSTLTRTLPPLDC